MSNDPGAPPVPAEYGAIRPGVDEAPTSGRLLRGRSRGGDDTPKDTAGDGAAPTRAARTASTATATDTVATPRAGRPEGDGITPPRPPRPADEMYRRRSRRDGGPQAVRARRSRRVVRRLDTWTVAKMSLVFYLCVLLVIIVAGVILWNIASSFGVIHSLDHSVKSLFAYKNFQLKPGTVLGYTVAGGAVLAVVGTIVNTLAALIYNLISDMVGGVQVIVLADDIDD